MTLTLDGFTFALLGVWLSPVLTALDFWRAWDRLPRRMAVHFDAEWRPNGWTTPDGALQLALISTVFACVVLTVAGLAVRSQKPRSSWAVLVIGYLVAGGMFWVNAWMVSTNLPA